MADLTRHPDVVDLAEYAEGLLDPTHHAAVDDHVRGCLDCTRVLSDLTELPAAMAHAPVPPMPTDVAERLDRAIAAESSARASGWSGAAMVTPIRPRRRWLAPVVAAAAVLGAIAIAVPVLDNSADDGAEDAASSDSSSTGGFDAERDESGVAPAPENEAGIPLPALSSDRFGRDVLDAFYHGSARLDAEYPMMTGQGDDTYRKSVETIPGLCSSDGPTSVPNGRVDAVTYDGAEADLLRLEVGRTVEAIAFRCDADGPDILDAVTLRPAG